MNTHGLVADFGKFKGELYTRIPVSYLFWMVNVGHEKSNIAKAELDRRGSVMPELEISGHAIDRSSIQCLDIWVKDRENTEGLHAWLVRVSTEALKSGEELNGKLIWKGMKFVFDTECKFPVLKTVIRTK